MEIAHENGAVFEGINPLIEQRVSAPRGRGRPRTKVTTASRRSPSSKPMALKEGTISELIAQSIFAAEKPVHVSILKKIVTNRGYHQSSINDSLKRLRTASIIEQGQERGTYIPYPGATLPESVPQAKAE